VGEEKRKKPVLIEDCKGINAITVEYNNAIQVNNTKSYKVRTSTDATASKGKG